MSQLKARCIEQVLMFENTPEISSGNVNYDSIKFDFCSSWDGFTKTAIFYRSEDEVYYRLLDDANTCTIPKEVLTERGVIHIGVFGVYDDKVLTSQVLSYRISQGAITENLKPSDPTPDIYAQIISRYDAIIDELEEQFQKLEDLQGQFDGAVGNADKLGGHEAEYFATAESVENIKNGTTPVGKATEADDAETLEGFGADHFLPKTGGTVENITLAPLTINRSNASANQVALRFKLAGTTLAHISAKSNGDFHVLDNNEVDIGKLLHTGNMGDHVLPIDGSKRIEAPNASVFKANNTNGANAYIGLYGSGNYIGGIGFTGNADYDLEVLNKNGSGGKKILHTGNMGDHVLPKNGGGSQPTISTNHPQVFSLDNVGENATTLLVFKHKGTIKGRIGTNWAGEAVYQNAEGTNYSFLHTGNSAKVSIGTTAPSDTSSLWVDTSV